MNQKVDASLPLRSC